MSAADEELDRLQYALTYWDFDRRGDEHQHLRNEVAAILDRYDVGPCFHVADLVLAAVNASADRLNQILYDLIPPDHWGVTLE